MADIANEYLVKRGNQEFATIASLFPGVRILKIDGYTALGEVKNIYTASWVNSQREDYMVTSQQTIGGIDYDVVFRANVDLEITFAVSDKYDQTAEEFDVRQRHDAFVAYMTDGALLLKSQYVERTLECVCLKPYKPTTEKLKRTRGTNYMIGTITLHTLDVRAGDDDGYVGNPYPVPSGGGGDVPTPTPISAYTDNVFDLHYNKMQSELNQEFAQKSKVQMTYSNETLSITIE